MQRMALMSDAINPDHYKSGDMECIDSIKASMTEESYRGYLKGSVQKNLWRYEDKHPKRQAEDLEKAEWFLNRLKMEVKYSEIANQTTEEWLSDYEKGERDVGIY